LPLLFKLDATLKDAFEVRLGVVGAAVREDWRRGNEGRVEVRRLGGEGKMGVVWRVAVRGGEEVGG
jgi:hypothetical protein